MAPRTGQSRIVQEIDGLERPFDEGEPEIPEVDRLEEAYQRGLAEGRRDGQQKAAVLFEQQATELRHAISESLKTLGGLQRAMADELRGQMIELGLEAASRIVRRKITADDPIAARALEEAVEAMPAGESLSARLHPDDLETVRADLADELSKQQIELQSDKSITRGGCVVEGPSGRIDATLETALSEVQHAAAGGPELS